MAKATIKAVYRIDGDYEVTYQSGCLKIYSVDNAPKTVLAWLEANKPQKPQQTVTAEPQQHVKATEEPEPQPVTEEPVKVIINPIAALQLAALFTAEKAVYIAWWICYVLGVIAGGAEAVESRINAAETAAKQFYHDTEPKIKAVIDAVRKEAVTAWDFRASIIAEQNGY